MVVIKKGREGKIWSSPRSIRKAKRSLKQAISAGYRMALRPNLACPKTAASVISITLNNDALMEMNRLAITKRILELHDKPIIVESKAEIGTTFTILSVYNPD
jgi:hypothetical protein